MDAKPVTQTDVYGRARTHPSLRGMQHRTHDEVPSLMLPPGLVKWLPRLEYVAGRCRNLEYVLIVHATGPRKK